MEGLGARKINLAFIYKKKKSEDTEGLITAEWWDQTWTHLSLT